MSLTGAAGAAATDGGGAAGDEQRVERQQQVQPGAHGGVGGDDERAVHAREVAQRREDRRHPHDQNKEGEKPCAFMMVEQVADDGAGDHGAGADAERLNETKSDK